MIASDIEEYLRPIYQSEALFVVALLSATYPTKIWTKFESDHFKNRFKGNSVVPVWFADAPVGTFDESRRVGGFTFDRGRPHQEQIRGLAATLLRKLSDSRADPEMPQQLPLEGSESA
jgi:hypothetical protein